MGCDVHYVMVHGVLLSARPDFVRIAGALAVEEFCVQFIRTYHGSHTSVLWLPMAEVREVLEGLGFFE